MIRRAPISSPARGFTLVEMLVTLVVVSLVSTLLWQALALTARLETQLARTRSLSGDEALRRAWVEQTLAGVMTGATGDPLRFTGRETRLTTYTSQPPWGGSSGPELMSLAIEPDPAAATDVGPGQPMALLARRGQHEPGSRDVLGRGRPLVLMNWRGEARIDYLDAQGQWRDRWPPFEANAMGAGIPDLPTPQAAGPLPSADAVVLAETTALPRAVRLTGLPGGVLLVPVVTGRNPGVTRRSLETRVDQQ